MSIPVLGIKADAPATGKVKTRPARTEPIDSPALRVAALVGFAIAAIGWTDLLFAWFPPDFGNFEWEFGTSSRTFDGLALGTIGFGALVGALAGLGRRRAIMVAAVVSSLMLLFVAGSALLYWLSIAPAWGASPQPIREALKVAFFRTSVFIVLYLVVYGWLTWFTWRGWRNTPKAETS